MRATGDDKAVSKPLIRRCSPPPVYLPFFGLTGFAAWVTKGT